MLPFGEIKKDVRNGYNYFEYETKWYGGMIYVILDRYTSRVIFDCTHWSDTRGDEPDGTEDYRFFWLPISEFMASSYKEILKRVNYCLFY